jgi:hypothetical protein
MHQFPTAPRLTAVILASVLACAPGDETAGSDEASSHHAPGASCNILQLEGPVHGRLGDYFFSDWRFRFEIDAMGDRGTEVYFRARPNDSDDPRVHDSPQVPRVTRIELYRDEERIGDAGCTEGRNGYECKEHHWATGNSEYLLSVVGFHGDTPTVVLGLKVREGGLGGIEVVEDRARPPHPELWNQLCPAASAASPGATTVPLRCRAEGATPGDADLILESDGRGLRVRGTLPRGQRLSVPADGRFATFSSCPGGSASAQQVSFSWPLPMLPDLGQRVTDLHLRYPTGHRDGLVELRGHGTVLYRFTGCSAGQQWQFPPCAGSI